MKNTLIAMLLTIGCVLGVQAQTTTTTTTSDNKDHYTVGDLDKLGKLELSMIYSNKVQQLNRLIAFIPFSQKDDNISLQNMQVPTNSSNEGMIDKLEKGIIAYNDLSNSVLTQMVPYADKDQVIKAILFMQETVERIQTGL